MVIVYPSGIYLSGYLTSAKLFPPAVNANLQFFMVSSMNFIKEIQFLFSMHLQDILVWFGFMAY